MLSVLFCLWYKLLTPQKEVFFRAAYGVVKREKHSLTRVSGVLQAAPRDLENCLNKTNGTAGEQLKSGEGLSWAFFPLTCTHTGNLDLLVKITPNFS